MNKNIVFLESINYYFKVRKIKPLKFVKACSFLLVFFYFFAPFCTQFCQSFQTVKTQTAQNTHACCKKLHNPVSFKSNCCGLCQQYQNPTLIEQGDFCFFTLNQNPLEATFFNQQKSNYFNALSKYFTHSPPFDEQFISLQC